MIQNYNGEQNARKKCIKITEKLSGFWLESLDKYKCGKQQ